MTSPTARTLKWLRELGYSVGHENFTQSRRGPKSVDLFNWCDLVIIGPRIVTDAIPIGAPRIIGLQVTSGSNHAARVAKAKPLAQPWIDAGGLAYVVSWARQGPRGKRKTWKVRVEAL